MIKKFNDFSDDFLFESLINESILYFSPVFKSKLQGLPNSEIAKILLNSEGKDLSSDITFIDISDEVGYLTFLPMSKGIEKIKRVFPNAEDSDLDNRYLPNSNHHIYNRDVENNRRVGIYHSNSNVIKIGKFTRKVLDSINPKNPFNSSDIERFVNDMKGSSILEKEFEIVTKICKEYRITNYTINNGLVDVSGNVNLYNLGLKNLPLKFGRVNGCFNCSDNQLTSLDGSPTTVGGHFYCSNNLLTSLEGGPKEVGGVFRCSGNQLVSLEGCPSEFNFIYCRWNPIEVIYNMFGSFKEYQDSLDYNYLRGTDIVKSRFKEALEEIGKKVPDKIPGYNYI